MRLLARRIGMGLLICGLGSAGTLAQGWHHIGKVQRLESFRDGLEDGVELTAGAAKVRITQIYNGVIRVRVAPNGRFPKNISWALAEMPLNYISGPVQIHDGKNEVKITAGTVNVTITKSPLLIDFSDASGNVLLADEPSLPMAWNGPRVHIWKKMPADENYYGLGDKAGPMNRRNRAFTNWNTDEFGWQESSDPLYKTIPFFIGLRKGVAYGVFFDNTYRSVFDFGKESRDYFSFGAEGGELNYYFIAGPEPKRIVEEYTALTGRAPLPPLWTLGYQQCRYSYYPESRAREIVKTFRDKKIPADVIYFDIDYQQGYAPFTINREYFPTFEKMIADFRAQGFHTILITDLHIKKDPGHGYAPYDSGIKNDVFVKNPDGSIYIGHVWPGESVFPDFTLTRVRNWWGGLYKDFVVMGGAGFWNDMNEPSVFFRADKTMPLDTVHRLDDGTTIDHRAAHNIFGMENARATYEGLLKLQAGERPFVLTRAAYSGAQRYAATWTGDNSSTWNHLKMSTPMLMSMGISGMPLVGDDIGGFAGSPTADLLTRWFEVGALNPIYRDHTAKGTADQEPWVHGPEHEAILAISCLATICLSPRSLRKWWTLKKSLFHPAIGTTFGPARSMSTAKNSSCAPVSMRCLFTFAPERSCPCNRLCRTPAKLQMALFSCTFIPVRIAAARSTRMTATPSLTRRVKSSASITLAEFHPPPSPLPAASKKALTNRGGIAQR